MGNGQQRLCQTQDLSIYWAPEPLVNWATTRLVGFENDYISHAFENDESIMI